MKNSNTMMRLRYIMDERKITQSDILNLAKHYCEKYNVRLNKSHISQYVAGKNEPGQDKIAVLSMALDVSEGWLMGYDVPMERQNRAEKLSDEAHESMDPKTAEFIRIWNKFTDEEKDAVISFMRAFKKTPPSENDGV